MRTDAGAALGVSDKRALVHRLYGLQGQFDCQFTHLRCAEQLVELGYLFRVRATDHPDPARRAEMAALTRETWLTDPDGATHGLFQPGTGDAPATLLFDPSMTAWSATVDAGLVRGLGAEPLPPFDTQEGIAALVTAAASLGNADLLQGLYGLAIHALAHGPQPPSPDHPALASARSAARASGLLDQPVLDWVAERFPVDERGLRWVPERGRAFATWWLGHD